MQNYRLLVTSTVNDVITTKVDVIIPIEAEDIKEAYMEALYKHYTWVYGASPYKFEDVYDKCDGDFTITPDSVHYRDYNRYVTTHNTSADYHYYLTKVVDPSGD